ncbi:MAG: chain-length determining protein [Methylococcaceae bacterium]
MILTKKESSFSNKLRRHSTLLIILLSSALAILYWESIASSRYISEAHILIEKTDLASGTTVDIGSLLGSISSNNQPDQLLLRDYLLSVDMLRKLDTELGLRAHYSDERYDIISRMWAFNVLIEDFYDYYLSRVSVEFDDYAGVLVIKAQAYNPEKAHAITAFLVKEGEYFMNEIAHDLARDQVNFLEKEVNKIAERTKLARQAVLNFQNKNNMASPLDTATNVVGIINGMEAQLSTLKTSRDAMLGYLMPDSPNVTELNLQISSIEKQIEAEKAKLTSTTRKTLNRTVEEYQILQMTAEFAQDVYKTALVALEKGRIDASRTLKKVSVLQTPTYPEDSLEPRRLYNSIVSILVILMVVGIVHLLTAIVRDHKD